MSIKIKGVYGNYLKVEIPLQRVTRSMVNGQVVATKTDFYPSADYPIRVRLQRSDLAGKGRIFTPTVNGNVITFTDSGTLLRGIYHIEVRCCDNGGIPYRYIAR